MPLNPSQIDWDVTEENYGYTIAISGRLNIKPYFYVVMRTDKFSYRNELYKQFLKEKMFKRLAKQYAEYEEEYQ